MRPTYFATPADFRAWFEKNHLAVEELLVGFYKRGSGKPSITWPESVDQALCFGWIDGIRRNVSEDAYSIRFTPRKKTSTWSAINVARVAELTRLGLMSPAGTSAFERRSAKKTAIYAYEQRAAAALTSLEESALRKNTRASTFFDAQAPWYRRTATHWVVSAKQEATRARRLAVLIACSAEARHIPPLTRPAAKRQDRDVTAKPTAKKTTVKKTAIKKSKASA